MTDKELLELAAKAAGYDVTHPVNLIRLNMDPPVVSLFIPNVSTAWNPLKDDGDALRLAVKLGMYLNIYTHPKMQQTNVGAASRYLVTEAHESDSGAATRRAITRAAAAIGKAMP